MTHNPKEASMATPTHDILTWRGQNLIDSRTATRSARSRRSTSTPRANSPEWALVTTGLFGTKQLVRPDQGRHAPATMLVTVPFEKSTVKDAPTIDPDGKLSEQEEAELYRHYGREDSESALGHRPAGGRRGRRPGTRPARRRRP